jgi:hypothetical protein
MKILVACEESQAVCIEFRKRGHEAYSCDVQECSGGHPDWHIKGDVLDYLTHGWDMMIAHPPCTYLCNSGVKHLYIGGKKKNGKDLDRWGLMYEAVGFYRKILNAKIYMKCIENPVMHPYASNLLKIRNRQVVQPWWFGDKTFKATGFELENLSHLIPTNKLIPPKPGTEEHKRWSWVHRLPPSKDRARLRSTTQPGIAKAMAAQWG